MHATTKQPLHSNTSLENVRIILYCNAVKNGGMGTNEKVFG
jgi:hypothetical protein